MAGLRRTFTFAFEPDPEGGFVATCPTLPGLVTHGDNLAEARDMARDAMLGYIEVLLEDGEPVPDDDQPLAASGGQSNGGEAGLVVEQLTASIAEAA